MDWFLLVILIIVILAFILIAASHSGYAAATGAAEGAMQNYLRDYLNTGTIDTDELERLYEETPLDYKNVKITKQMFSRAKRLDAITRKIVTHTLLHLHVLKTNINNVSLAALKKDKTFLSQIVSLAKKEKKMDEVDLDELKELISLITTELAATKGAPVNKISSDVDELSLKVLLQSDLRSDTDNLRLLRKCREDNEILRNRIVNLQSIPSVSASMVDQLLRERAALEARVRELSARADCSAYQATINKLQRDLSDCEQNLQATLAALP